MRGLIWILALSGILLGISIFSLCIGSASIPLNKIINLIVYGFIYKAGPPQKVLTYKIIEEVYKTAVLVKENPISSKPYVFLVSEEERQKKGRA